MEAVAMLRNWTDESQQTIPDKRSDSVHRRASPQQETDGQGVMERGSRLRRLAFTVCVFATLVSVYCLYCLRHNIDKDIALLERSHDAPNASEPTTLELWRRMSTQAGHGIVGPAISDGEWDKLCTAGALYSTRTRTPLEYIHHDDPVYHPSDPSFLDESALSDSGWAITTTFNRDETPMRQPGVLPVLQSLKLDAGLPAYKPVVVQQPLDWRAPHRRGGGPYRGVGAFFGYYMHTDGGVITIQEALGPRAAAAKHHIPEHMIAPLRSLSDVTYLSWKRQVALDDNAQIEDLRYIMITMIVNELTLAAIKRAFGASIPPITSVPTFAKRATFDVEDGLRPGLGLLGSPTLAGVARLLIEHKQELGDKYISKISI